MLNTAETCKAVSCVRYDSEDNGFCSSSLLLNSDSSFLLEHRCENRSEITIGQWGISNDSIVLTPLSRQDIEPICALEMLQGKSNEEAVFFVIDNTGNPVSGFIIIASKANNDYSEKSRFDLYDVQDSNKGVIYETDIYGIAKVCLTDIENIDFFSLNFLTDSICRLPKRLISAEVKVTLNFNRWGLDNFNLEYDSNENNKIYYSISKDKQTIGYMRLSLDK